MDKSNLSPKMKKAITNITLVTGKKFKGSTFEEASKFISENIAQLEGVDFREKKKPSANMKKGIDFCESVLGVKFTGSTMKEASEFLGKYLQKAHDEIDRRKHGQNSSS